MIHDSPPTASTTTSCNSSPNGYTVTLRMGLSLPARSRRRAGSEKPYSKKDFRSDRRRPLSLPRRRHGSAPTCYSNAVFHVLILILSCFAARNPGTFGRRTELWRTKKATRPRGRTWGMASALPGESAGRFLSARREDLECDATVCFACFTTRLFQLR